MSTAASEPNPVPGEDSQVLTTTIQATPLPFRSGGAGTEVAPTPASLGEEETGVRFILIVEKELEIQAYPLKKVIHTIGRSADNSIRIQDRYLSRHHAYLVRVPSGSHYTYSLFDGDRERSLPSRNGVFVNDRRIKSHSLSTGDVIYFGPNVRAMLCSVELSENSEQLEERVPVEMSR